MPNPSDSKATSTTSTELLDTLTQRAQERNSRVESSLALIQQSVSGCANSLNESAMQFRRDMAEEVRQDRKLQRRWLTWGPVALVCAALLTVGLCACLTWYLVSSGTTSALGTLQQQAATQLVEVRSQVEAAKLELATAKAALETTKAEAVQIQSTVKKDQTRLTELRKKIEDATEDYMSLPKPIKDPRWTVVEPRLTKSSDGNYYLLVTKPLQTIETKNDPNQVWVKIQ